MFLWLFGYQEFLEVVEFTYSVAAQESQEEILIMLQNMQMNLDRSLESPVSAGEHQPLMLVAPPESLDNSESGLEVVPGTLNSGNLVAVVSGRQPGLVPVTPSQIRMQS